MSDSNNNNNKRKKKRKKRKVMVPVVESWRTMKSRKRARKVTSEFHKLYAKKKTGGDKDGQIEKQIRELGGHRAYQEASVLSTSHNRTTSRWVFKHLSKEHETSKTKLRTLEVGAINTHISACPWMDVTAIDLNSLHPKIQECNFFDLRPESCFDVVVCAMVLNFVPTCVCLFVFRSLSLFFFFFHHTPTHPPTQYSYIRYREVRCYFDCTNNSTQHMAIYSWFFLFDA
jgi:hypothetical protein